MSHLTTAGSSGDAAESHPRAAHINLPERFDEGFRRQFREACFAAHPDSGFVVDFSQTTYINSSGLGMLLFLRDQSADVTLINANDEIKDMLKIVQFDRLFQFE